MSDPTNRGDTPAPTQNGQVNNNNNGSSNSNNIRNDGRQSCLTTRKLFFAKIKALDDWLDKGHKITSVKYIKHYKSVLDTLYEGCIWLGPHDDELRRFGDMNEEIANAGCARWAGLMTRLTEHEAFKQHLNQIEKEALELQSNSAANNNISNVTVPVNNNPSSNNANLINNSSSNNSISNNSNNNNINNANNPIPIDQRQQFIGINPNQFPLTSLAIPPPSTDTSMIGRNGTISRNQQQQHITQSFEPPSKKQRLNQVCS